MPITDCYGNKLSCTIIWLGCIQNDTILVHSMEGDVQVEISTNVSQRFEHQVRRPREWWRHKGCTCNKSENKLFRWNEIPPPRTSSIYPNFNIWPWSLTLVLELFEQMSKIAHLLMMENNCAKNTEIHQTRISVSSTNPFISTSQTFCRFLTFSQTSPGFYVSAVQVFWKHCGRGEIARNK